MRIRPIVTTLLLLASVGVAQKPAADTWAPLRYLVGSWEGTGNGQPGLSKVQREYRLVLNDKFLHVQNRSVYDPQPKNPKGETHEDWGMISFDKGRKQFVKRAVLGDAVRNVRDAAREISHTFTLTAGSARKGNQASGK